jgi:RNA polymerase sigma factor (sigma-70 family)
MNACVSDPPTELTLEHLFKTYRKAVYGICYGFTRSAEDAQDLVQETFVKAHLGLAGFEGRSHPKTWLTRIAINQSLTSLKDRSRGRLNRNAYLIETEREQQLLREYGSSEKMEMHEALQSVDGTTRKVLLMAFRDGLTHSEIAITLGVSRVAVTRRITRFRVKAGLEHDAPVRIRSRIARKKTGASEWMLEPASLDAEKDGPGFAPACSCPTSQPAGKATPPTIPSGLF